MSGLMLFIRFCSSRSIYFNTENLCSSQPLTNISARKLVQCFISVPNILHWVYVVNKWRILVWKARHARNHIVYGCQCIQVIIDFRIKMNPEWEKKKNKVGGGGGGLSILSSLVPIFALFMTPRPTHMTMIGRHTANEMSRFAESFTTRTTTLPWVTCYQLLLVKLHSSLYAHTYTHNTHIHNITTRTK